MRFFRFLRTLDVYELWRNAGPSASCWSPTRLPTSSLVEELSLGTAASLLNYLLEIYYIDPGCWSSATLIYQSPETPALRTSWQLPRRKVKSG
jgi:hypothetical protein